MKKYPSITHLFLVLIVMMSIFGKAQNLVLNPSFETVNAANLQCSWYTTQAQFNSAISNWTCPTGGSSDIFVNSLAGACFCSPNSSNASSYGTQAPRTGNVMVGGSLYGTGGCTPYREYVQGSLSSNLLAGTTYKIEFYISLGDNSSVGCNNIGLKFSTAPVNLATMCVYGVTPDVNYTGTPITDKVNWTKLEFCYTPTVTGLQYFVIGNFFTNVASASTNVGGTQGNAYYFLDDVSITPSTTLAPTASLISNCSSPSTTLTGLPAAVNYTWTPPAGGAVLTGLNSQVSTVQGNGIYTLSVQNPTACNTSVTTTTILVNNVASSLNPIINAPGTITCNTPTLALSSSPTTGVTYVWSGPGVLSGGTTSSPVIGAPGNYTLVVTNTAGCTGTVVSAVAQSITAPVITITPTSSTITCVNPTAPLTSIITPAISTFTWSSPGTGSLSSSIISNPIATGSGVFTLTATNPANGCVNSATTTLVAGVGTVTLSVNSASICNGSFVTLTAIGNATSYSWSPGSSLSTSTGSTVIASPITTTIYTVTGVNSGCTASVVATVTVSPLPVPSITTPGIITCTTPTLNLNAFPTTGLSYIWSGPGIVSGGTTLSPVINVAGDYSVTVTNSAGCSATATTSVTQNTTPPIVSITPLSSTITCANPTALLTSGITPSSSTFTWSSPGTGSLSNSSITNPAASGNGTFTLTATNPVNGCVNTATTSVITGIVTVTLSANGASICNGSSTGLSVTGNATSYLWVPSASLNTSVGTSVMANPGSTTVYTITGTSGACTSSVAITVTVMPVPNPVIIPATQTICLGQNASLTASGALGYSWSPSATLNTSTGSSVTANPTVTTIYTMVSSIGTCTASSQATVNVLSNPSITIVGDSLICNGSTSLLSIYGVTNFTITPSISVNSISGNVALVNPLATTIYTINGTVGTCSAVAQKTITVQAMPLLVVSPSQTICSGASATLTASGFSSYLWTPASSLNSATASTVISTPAVTTNYIVTGTNGVCTNTASCLVNVNAIPVVSISPANASVCLGSSIVLTASGAATYTWSPLASLNSTTSNSVIASPLITTQYTVVGSTLGCTGQAIITVTVNIIPVLAISPSSTICSGSSTNLTVSGANSYNWFPMSGLTTSSGINVLASPLVSSSYTITGSSVAGCTNTISVSVTVIPTPTLTALSSPTIICEGRTSTLTASGASFYDWSPSLNLSDPSLGTSIASPSVTTIYTVTGTNGVLPYQCVSTKTVEVIVTPTVTPVVPLVRPICYGESTSLVASGATSYTWNPTSNSLSPNQSTVIIKPLVTTVYTVTVGNGLCLSQSTVEVVVNMLPEVNAGADTIVNIDEYVFLNGTGNVPVEFLATTSVPLNCNFCSSISVNPQEKTCYTLRGISSAGCVAYDEVCVNVTKDWNVYIPNAFTPNGDNDNDYFFPVGYGLTQIKLFIFNRWGTQIFAGDDATMGWDGKLKGKLCEQGVYIYQVEIKTMAGNIIKKVGHVTLLAK